jgi:hypothetical protein
MNSTLETSLELPKKICVLVKKVILKDGTLKEYTYNQSKYNNNYYAKNKDRIECGCGGFYNKSSKFTHCQRSKTHQRYIKSLEEQIE